MRKIIYKKPQSVLKYAFITDLECVYVCVSVEITSAVSGCHQRPAPGNPNLPELTDFAFVCVKNKENFHVFTFLFLSHTHTLGKCG